MPKPKKPNKPKTLQVAKQFAQYMVGGGVWFWSAYSLISFLDNHIGLFWANFIGNGVGVSLNFIVQRYWAFDSSKNTDIKKATTRYVIYTGLNIFVLNYFILLGLKDVFGLQPEISQFISAGFFTVWNYVWYKVWVFKDAK